ncbi:MAG: hypothetical protein DRJ51_07560 [Thermoprotei archaeon]|nr:MAG: hypothetical protein DRJ51_07560 [Thermoprotei archaeon]
MKKIVHRATGLVLGILLYDLLYPLPRFDLNGFLLLLLFTPYAYVKVINAASSIKLKREDKAALELLKLFACYVILFVLPQWLKVSRFHEIIDRLELVLSTLLAEINNIIPLNLLLFAEYSLIFSTIMDVKNDPKDPLFHSLLFVGLGYLTSICALSVITAPIYALSISNLFLVCCILHLLEDSISSEGSTPLYPFIRSRIFSEVISKPSILRKIENIMSGILLLLSLLIILLLIGRNLLIQHVVSIALSPWNILMVFIAAILLPVPILAYLSTSPRKRTISPLRPTRCPNCNRIVPSKSRTCPYCGSEVKG